VLWSVTLAANVIAMRMQSTRQMAIVVTAIGIMLLLVLTVWQKVESLPTPATATAINESSETLAAKDSASFEEPPSNSNIES
jgi:hypothetical protein